MKDFLVTAVALALLLWAMPRFNRHVSRIAATIIVVSLAWLGSDSAPLWLLLWVPVAYIAACYSIKFSEGDSDD